MTGQKVYLGLGSPRITGCLVAFLFMLLIAGCSIPAVDQSLEARPNENLKPSETASALGKADQPLPSATALVTTTPEITDTPTATPVVVLAPEPVRVDFVAEDGAELTGYYYPASENPAPVIVLMHWARGDQTEWDPVARWLQGRDLLNREADYNHSWTSSVWYPERDLDFPLGVFTFTFRSCQGGCQTYQVDDWLLDARAAVKAVAGLPGADPDNILTAGASIGGDAALDGCLWLNETGIGRCPGSFSLSPGSFLTESYPVDFRKLRTLIPDAPVYCLYGLRDDASVETCESDPDLKAVNYGYVEYHGMELLRPYQDPDPLQLLEDFIRQAVQRTQ